MFFSIFFLHVGNFSTIIGLEQFWTLFIGVGVVWGTTMMFIDPTGVMWGMEPMLEMRPR